MNTRIALTVLAVAGCGGLLWLAASLASSAGPTEAAPAVAAPRLQEQVALSELGRGRSAGPVADSRRAHGEGQTASLNTAAVPVPESRTLRGRVVYPGGSGLAGVEVAFTSPGREPQVGTSGAGGAFRFDASRTSGRVATVDPRFESLFAFHPRPTSEAEMLLVVAPHRPLAGVVRDGTGAPLPGARVALWLPEGFRTRFDAVLDSADHGEWTATTDAAGRFRIERAPEVADATVEARLDGYETTAVAAQPGADEALELVLHRPEATAAILAGRVVDARGEPVHGARASLGERSAITARDGTFRLDRADAYDAFELVAVYPGRQPGRYRALADPVSGAPLWPDWVEIALGGEALELAGRVVDQHGRPRPRVKLWLDDPTRFGLIDGDTLGQLELLAAPEDSTYEPGDAYFRATRTDAEGHFRLQGLLERDYRLGLLDGDTLESLRTGPFAAGRDDLEIELPRAEPGRLFGRLVSRRGRPVEGARVALYAHAFGGVHHQGAEATTDAEGRFDFEGFAGTGLSLWIRGDQIVPSMHGANPSDEELELVVDVLCHFKVDLGDTPELADSVRAYDADGKHLDLHEIGAGGHLATTTSNLVDGRSVALGVSDAVATLVLEKDEVEVRRLSIHLEPGSLQVVSP